MLCIRAYVPPYLLFVQPVGVGQRQQVKPQSQHRVTALDPRAWTPRLEIPTASIAVSRRHKSS